MTVNTLIVLRVKPQDVKADRTMNCKSVFYVKGAQVLGHGMCVSVLELCVPF